MLAKEDVRVTFYSVKRCGFYAWGADTVSFGGLADTFAQLHKWGHSSELSITKILDPTDDEESLPVYLLATIPSGSDYVFALWNETPSAENAVTSISKNSVVGNPQIHANPLTANTIPGYATYFWVVPEKNVIASVKFIGLTSGVSSMENYVKRFLALKSTYVIDGAADTGEYVVAGYSDKNDGVPTKAFPRFKVQAFRKKGRRQYLLDNYARITKVIRTGHVKLDKVVDKGIFQSLISFCRGDTTAVGNATGIRSAKVELQYTPTEPELTAMMEAEDQDSDNTRWEDLGFELNGESGGPIWINRSRASDTFQLEVERVAPEVITVQSIAVAIASQRAQLLQLLVDA